MKKKITSIIVDYMGKRPVIVFDRGPGDKFDMRAYYIVSRQDRKKVEKILNTYPHHIEVKAGGLWLEIEINYE